MFDNKPPDKDARTEIEKRIITIAEVIRTAGREVGCIEESTMMANQSAWSDLENYYETHDDVMIAIEVVRDFLDTLDILIALKSKNLSDECYDIVYEALSDTEAYMDGIITAVNFRLYPDGW
jgi:hypothetical protein